MCKKPTYLYTTCQHIQEAVHCKGEVSKIQLFPTEPGMTKPGTTKPGMTMTGMTFFECDQA
jgi:hypothetical protein